MFYSQFLPLISWLRQALLRGKRSMVVDIYVQSFQSIKSIKNIIMISNMEFQQTNEQIPTNDTNPNNKVFMICNQGVANGFGDMFFNIRDPTFTQKNDPVKQQSSFHSFVIAGTVIFFACLIVGAVGYKYFLTVIAAATIISIAYLVYLVLSICCSDLRIYINNMKPNSQYEQTYNKMVQGKGFFVFWIQCYHYRVVKTKNGATMKRIVTHTATETYQVPACFDESGQIGSIKDIKDYIFIHYLKRYYFTDDVSQNRFIAAFNDFVHRNTRDSHQSYTHTFDIEGYEEFTSFSVMGEGGRSRASFYIFTLLGLGLPYAYIFERYVARYDVGVLKRLTI